MDATLHEGTFEIASFTDRDITNVLIPVEHGISASGLAAASDGHLILVVWESLAGLGTSDDRSGDSPAGMTRLAGRLVLIEPARRRAVR